jgi:tRNA-dihydrouridine synthase
MPELIFKNIIAEVSGEDRDKKQRDYIISSENEDLDGDILISKGCDLELYNKKPFIYYNHITSGPDAKQIGRSLWVKDTGAKILARAEFNIKNALAMEIYESTPDYYNSASVGFLPCNREDYEIRDCSSRYGSLYWECGENKGRLIKKWKLIEWSVLSAIPANYDSDIIKSIKSLRQKGLELTAKELEKHITILQITEELKSAKEEIAEMVAKFEKQNETIDDIKKHIGILMQTKRASESVEKVAEKIGNNNSAEDLIAGVFSDMFKKEINKE